MNARQILEDMELRTVFCFDDFSLEKRLIERTCSKFKRELLKLNFTPEDVAKLEEFFEYDNRKV